MARDPVRMLRTVRRFGIEQARRALAACLAAEMAAAEHRRALDEAARLDRVADPKVSEAHRFVEMFALRRQAGVAERDAADVVLAATQAASADARAALVAARTAAEALETLVGERAEAAQMDARRREQHTLDDIARARFDSTER